MPAYGTGTYGTGTLGIGSLPGKVVPLGIAESVDAPISFPLRRRTGAVTLVGKYVSAADAITHTGTFSAAVAVGATLIVLTVGNVNNLTFSITDTKANTYTRRGATNSGTLGTTMNVHTSVVTAAILTSTTFTVTRSGSSSGGMSIYVYQVDGIDQSQLANVTATSFSSSTAGTTASLGSTMNMRTEDVMFTLVGANPVASPMTDGGSGTLQNTDAQTGTGTRRAAAVKTNRQGVTGSPLSEVPTLGMAGSTNYSILSIIFPGVSSTYYTDLSRATESDITNPLGIQQPLGLATDTNTALALTQGSQTVTLNQASEADTAQPLTLEAAPPPQVIDLGQASSTNTAQPLTPVLGPLTRPLGQSVDSETAQPLSVALGPLTRPLGQPSESETAQGLTRAYGTLTVTLGQPGEGDTAQGLALTQGRALGQVIETETALGLTRVLGPLSKPLPLVVEIDTAPGLSKVLGPLVRSLGQASDTETALVLDPVYGNVARTLPVIVEIESASGLTRVYGPLVLPLGQAQDTETASGLTRVYGTLTRPLGLATAVESAQPLGEGFGSLVVPLPGVVETETAIGMAPVLGVLRVPLGQTEEADLALGLQVAQRGERTHFLWDGTAYHQVVLLGWYDAQNATVHPVRLVGWYDAESDSLQPLDSPTPV